MRDIYTRGSGLESSSEGMTGISVKGEWVRCRNRGRTGRIEVKVVSVTGKERLKLNGREKTRGSEEIENDRHVWRVLRALRRE